MTLQGAPWVLAGLILAGCVPDSQQPTAVGSTSSANRDNVFELSCSPFTPTELVDLPNLAGTWSDAFDDVFWFERTGPGEYRVKDEAGSESPFPSTQTFFAIDGRVFLYGTYGKGDSRCRIASVVMSPNELQIRYFDAAALGEFATGAGDVAVSRLVRQDATICRLESSPAGMQRLLQAAAARPDEVAIDRPLVLTRKADR